MENKLEVSSLEELKAFSSAFINENTTPLIVCLNGDLSAGKTQLVKFFVSCIGGDEAIVSSPTYSLINEYVVSGKTIFHCDLYRIESPEELEQIGFWDLLDQSFDYFLIEWASKFDISPAGNFKTIDIKKLSETKRLISY